MEDFHLLVALWPPQLKNSACHGATRHARRT
ncbi:virulence protein, partial [Photorhabdus heterorhabditis]|nr:virulence protein [Photorhabdus heterorhabditis]